jgi:hypothetical protein
LNIDFVTLYDSVLCISSAVKHDSYSTHQHSIEHNIDEVYNKVSANSIVNV